MGWSLVLFLRPLVPSPFVLDSRLPQSRVSVYLCVILIKSYFRLQPEIFELSREEFKILFDAYFETVRNFIYYRCGDTELATDVSQESFMKIWEKGLSPEPGKELALLYRIAGSIFISRYRKTQSAMNYRKSITLKVDDFSPNDQMEYNELKEKYDKALQNMTEKKRVVFLMSRFEELTYKEIAERLQISVKAVEKRMSQALGSLRKALY